MQLSFTSGKGNEKKQGCALGWRRHKRADACEIECNAIWLRRNKKKRLNKSGKEESDDELKRVKSNYRGGKD
jgi:hypothetical protein